MANRAANNPTNQGRPVDRLLLRWIVRNDMDEIMAIEKASFDEPWTEDDFVVQFKQRNHIGMAAILDGIVAGYMIYELHRDHLFILTMAVHPCLRRIGVGRAMVEKVVGKLSVQRRRFVRTAVREDNLRAQQFFKSCGFHCTRIVPEHFVGLYGAEDAYEMQRFHDRREVWPVCRNRNRISHLLSKGGVE